MTEQPVAIVTAAGQGMGEASARELSARGYALALMSPSGASTKLAGELGGIGLDGSVTETADLEKLVAMTLDKHGRIDAVVNNTGHAPWSQHASGPGFDPDVNAPLLDIPEEEIIVCGMALGFEDETKPENTLRSERAPLEEFVSFVK